MFLILIQTIKLCVAVYTEGKNGNLNIFSNTAVNFRPNTPSGAQMDVHAKYYNMANDNFTNANAFYAAGLEVRDHIDVKKIICTSRMLQGSMQ